MRHDIEMKAFAAKLKKTPPVECGFKIDDQVTFTNDYGVKFEGLRVIGFDTDDSFYGRFIYLDTDCYWFAKKPSSLTHE